MQPKIVDTLEKYPKIKSIYIDMDKSHKIGISYDFFTVPGLLLFVQGKETIRQAGNMSIYELDEKIARYYGMLF